MYYADHHCTYTEKQNPHRYVYSGRCVVMGTPFTVEVPAEELFRYRQGELAQNAFTSLNREQRELLISGISPEGWVKVYGFPQKLIILQGPPGSGKSTLARQLQCRDDKAVIVSTDDRHYNEKGEYAFNPEKIAEYHAATQKKAAKLLELGCTVIVDNTNILNAHIKPYVEAALVNEVCVEFIRVTGKYSNIHNVPDEVVARMLEKMEDLSVEGALACGSLPNGSKAT